MITRRCLFRSAAVVTGTLAARTAPGQPVAYHKRRAELERLLARLPESEYFNRWLKETGELPPDFEALPSVPYIQDPLSWPEGGEVSRSEWPRRREQIVKLCEEWLLGTAPPPPGNVAADILETTQDRGHEVWKVRLRFGPDHAAKLGATLYLPKDRSRPAPVFLCDGEYYLRWAEGAMAQGFGFCVHAARDSSDDSWAYAKLFGDYDWSSFRRRGWSASRVVDWLITLPFVDSNRIFIGGHSRSGKQAMCGAAFDERIAGVLDSSAGSGGSIPYRYCDQSYFAESAEILTRRFPDWVHPRVRFFCGRENKLPADSHFLCALIAPRPLILSTGTEDGVESTWSIEQVYKTIQPLYMLLGAPQNLGFHYRPGPHDPNEAAARAYSEFLLTAAGRTGKTVAQHFPFTPIHVWDYDAWARQNAPKPAPAAGRVSAGTLGQPSTEDWKAKREEILRQIQWLLGDGPAYQPMPVKPGEGEPDDLAQLLARDLIKTPARTKIRFGPGVNGYIFSGGVSEAMRGVEPGKHACVIWLSPFHTPLGFAPRGNLSSQMPPVPLASAGFATLAYDHIGTGGRKAERRDFYEKHPHWSLMGKMVLDARHAIDAALTSPGVDPNNIYLYGFAMGGMVAILVAALDDRVAGVATVAGFTPMRTDISTKGTGGVRRYSHFYGWMPRLGPYLGREDRIPVDFPEILAAVAPRRVLVVAPQLDWHAALADVEAAVSQARNVYASLGRPDDIQIQTPYEENRLTDLIQGDVISWLKSGSTHQDLRRGGY